MPNSSADNSISDTPTTELTPAEPAAVSATPKWDKVEQERLTRRAALRKMGYTSGIAIFSMFAVDDLARMAIQKMEQHKETKQIAETVAKEFKNTGIAFALPQSSAGSGGCDNGSTYPSGSLSGSQIGHDCHTSPNWFCDDTSTFEDCISKACDNYNGVDATAAENCMTNARNHNS